MSTLDFIPSQVRNYVLLQDAGAHRHTSAIFISNEVITDGRQSDFSRVLICIFYIIPRLLQVFKVEL